ncbi:MAG: GNAT family N-acetyltransferase [Candidatus Thermoplasmatota archaeon]|nr:GNAT family N-acetyltransferase [Candidatus Thermoplasmatota archaeon]
MKIDIVPLDPETATREEWARYHAYRRLRHEETDPADPIIDDTSLEALWKRPDPQGKALRFAVLAPDKPETQVGYVEFSVFKEGAPSYEGNEHLAQTNIALLESYRRKGLGKDLLTKVAELAEAQGKSRLIGSSDEEDGKVFARALGAEIALEGLENRLDITRVQWDMVEGWAAAGPERSPTSTIHWYTNHIDEAILEDYCKFYTEVFNQQPFGQLDVKDLVFDSISFRDREARVADVGGSWITALTMEEEGKISGMTEMFYLPDRETMIGQGLTGVKEAYRGRGLGKWLKATMLLRVRDQLPQVTVVQTGNATENEAMLSINRRLGFEKYKEAESFQITLEALQKYLAAS